MPFAQTVATDVLSALTLMEALVLPLELPLELKEAAVWLKSLVRGLVFLK
jgi:hypothetical protein